RASSGVGALDAAGRPATGHRCTTDHDRRCTAGTAGPAPALLDAHRRHLRGGFGGVRAPWQTGTMPLLMPFLPDSSADAGQDAIVDGFIAAQESVGRTLYPHQEESLLA